MTENMAAVLNSLLLLFTDQQWKHTDGEELVNF